MRRRATVTEEREAFDKLKAERGCTMRDLVVTSVLGSEPSDMLARLIDIERRVRALETKR